jgi:hypothetical protein
VDIFIAARVGAASHSDGRRAPCHGFHALAVHWAKDGIAKQWIEQD